MSQRFRFWLMLCATAWLGFGSACGDDESSAHQDAGVPSDASVLDDAAVEYKGPTRGGAIPVPDAAPPPTPDDGPFVVDMTCCEHTLSVPAIGGETSVRLVGNLPPVAGQGVTAELVNGAYQATACLPAHEALQLRFEVEVTSDAGASTQYRTDPDELSLEDENGARWNLWPAGCDAPDAGS